jgi:hypothetical protein
MAAAVAIATIQTQVVGVKIRRITAAATTMIVGIVKRSTATTTDEIIQQDKPTEVFRNMSNHPKMQ